MRLRQRDFSILILDSHNPLRYRHSLSAWMTLVFGRYSFTRSLLVNVEVPLSLMTRDENPYFLIRVVTASRKLSAPKSLIGHNVVYLVRTQTPTANQICVDFFGLAAVVLS